MDTTERFPTCTGSKGLGDFDFGFSIPGQTSEILPLRIWPDPPSAIHHRLATHRRRVSTVITQEGKDLRQSACIDQPATLIRNRSTKNDRSCLERVRVIVSTWGRHFRSGHPIASMLPSLRKGLKTVDLVNSAVQDICDAAPGFGGTWNSDGVIVFAPGITGPLYKVPAAGGTPEPVTKIGLAGSESHHWPFFLPDGNQFLYFVNWNGPSDAQRNGVYATSLGSDTPSSFSPKSLATSFSPQVICSMYAIGPSWPNPLTPAASKRPDPHCR
jgi:hypothetical protein